MSKADTWMPFYVGDYLSATGRLTTEQHGAYLLILLDCWKNGPPPNDDAVLAALARMSLSAWKKAKPALIGFFDVANGFFVQKRVEKERERAASVTEERSKAGKVGAAKRWQNGSPKNGKAIANAINLPLANGQQNDAPSQSQCSNEHIASSNEDVSVEPTAQPLTKREVIDAWQDRMVPQGFPAIRKMTGLRERQLRARLRDSTLDEWLQAMAALERSAFCRGENDRGWKADFDFLLQPKSFVKLLEGSYDH
ncbi:MAG: YdaU family protein [Sphingomonas sp.]|nr:YdaU family protein [Sphingomonas sp.]